MQSNKRLQTIGILVALLAFIIGCYMTCGTRQKILRAQILSHLREVHQALHDHLERHNFVWPRDPNKVLADARVHLNMNAHEIDYLFTLYDLTPQIAYKWPQQPWLQFNNMESEAEPHGTKYLLFPDGHIEEQVIPTTNNTTR